MREHPIVEPWVEKGQRDVGFCMKVLMGAAQSAARLSTSQ